MSGARVDERLRLLIGISVLKRNDKAGPVRHVPMKSKNAPSTAGRKRARASLSDSSANGDDQFLSGTLVLLCVPPVLRSQLTILARRLRQHGASVEYDDVYLAGIESARHYHCDLETCVRILADVATEEKAHRCIESWRSRTGQQDAAVVSRRWAFESLREGIAQRAECYPVHREPQPSTGVEVQEEQQHIYERAIGPARDAFWQPHMPLASSAGHKRHAILSMPTSAAERATYNAVVYKPPNRELADQLRLVARKRMCAPVGVADEQMRSLAYVGTFPSVCVRLLAFLDSAEPCERA